MLTLISSLGNTDRAVGRENRGEGNSQTKIQAVGPEPSPADWLLIGTEDKIIIIEEVRSLNMNK